MQPWTHWVRCREAEKCYDKDYEVKAVEKNGKWHLCERNLAGMQYGQVLTVTHVGKARA